MLVRDCKHTDANALAQIAAQTGGRNAEGICLVAESDNGLVSGYVIYVGLPRRLSIEGIGVLADSRRLKYGTALINEVKRICVRDGLEAIDIVAPTKWMVTAFLRSCGFKMLSSSRTQVQLSWTAKREHIQDE